MQIKQLGNLQTTGIFLTLKAKKWQLLINSWSIANYWCTPTTTSLRNEDNLPKLLSNVSLNELNNDEIQIHKTLTTTNKKAIKQAKLKELDQWTKEVYDEVNANL